MDSCNYKVVAELRPDLPKKERNSVLNNLREGRKRVAI